MSDLEIERKESLTRQETPKRLMAIGEALTGGDEVELDLGGTSVSLRVADDVRGALPRPPARPRTVRRTERPWKRKSRPG